eukprot:TRINITY_DN7710_c0_g1_i1.p1 TRINITY_DN7710_c0_g1~~TRINITY_DN7710_c0_g1_i1.p1  ORF type:complete len:345 (+),score=11.29 TRINITY_DN7710_c0_g1_i1:119-1036(+)
MTVMFCLFIQVVILFSQFNIMVVTPQNQTGSEENTKYQVYMEPNDSFLPKQTSKNRRNLARATLMGETCALIYEHEGQTFDDCFIAPNEKEYCKTNIGIVRECAPLPPVPEPEPEKEFVLIPSPEPEPKPEPEPEVSVARYTVSGEVCAFPVVYEGQVHNNCIKTDSGTEICFANREWQECQPIGQWGPSRKLTDGRICKVPFIYNGQQQYDCVQMPDEKEYCKVDGAWQQCAPKESSQIQIKHDSYYSDTDYFSGANDINKDDGTAKGGVGGIVAVTVVVTILVVAAIGTVIVILYLRRMKRTQ